MTVKELIAELEKCNQDMEIQVFDELSRPYRIKSIFVDTSGNCEMSNITLEPMELD